MRGSTGPERSSEAGRASSISPTDRCVGDGVANGAKDPIGWCCAALAEFRAHTDVGWRKDGEDVRSGKRGTDRERTRLVRVPVLKLVGR